MGRRAARQAIAWLAGWWSALHKAQVGACTVWVLKHAHRHEIEDGQQQRPRDPAQPGDLRGERRQRRAPQSGRLVGARRRADDRRRTAASGAPRLHTAPSAASPLWADPARLRGAAQGGRSAGDHGQHSSGDQLSTLPGQNQLQPALNQVSYLRRPPRRRCAQRSFQTCLPGRAGRRRAVGGSGGAVQVGGGCHHHHPASLHRRRSPCFPFGATSSCRLASETPMVGLRCETKTQPPSPAVCGTEPAAADTQPSAGLADAPGVGSPPRALQQCSRSGTAVGGAGIASTVCERVGLGKRGQAQVASSLSEPRTDAQSSGQIERDAESASVEI